MHVDLTGKVVLISGAGGVIGRAMALEFARNDAIVCATDISDKGLAATKQACQEIGKDCVTIVANLSDKADIERLVKETVEKCGGIDVLCNNAGINGWPDERKNYWIYNDELFDSIVDIDLCGVYAVSKAALKIMLQNKAGGSIVNTASVTGIVPLRLQCAYCAAKAGVISMTKAMALELGDKKIRVNALCPGSVRTPQTDALFYSDPGRKKGILSHVIAGRSGEPEEMASLVCYLASDDAAYITGQIIPVDGGWVTGYVADYDSPLLK